MWEVIWVGSGFGPKPPGRWLTLNLRRYRQSLVVCTALSPAPPNSNGSSSKHGNIPMASTRACGRQGTRKTSSVTSASVSPFTTAPDRPLSSTTIRTPMLTIKEVASYLSVSERTVSRLARAGRLRAISIGGSIRFHAVDVDRFAQGPAPREGADTDLDDFIARQAGLTKGAH